MRKFLFAATAAAALAVVVPAGQVKASWLSAALHSVLSPAAYGQYAYYGPAYSYFPPAYSYAPFYGYYTVPYAAPYRAYWYGRGYYAPRYRGRVGYGVGPRYWRGWYRPW